MGIRIIFIDIDGTLINGEIDKDLMMEIKDIGKLANKKNILLSLCSGRSQPFVNKIGNIIGTPSWNVCENGSVLYHSSEGSIIKPMIPSDYDITKFKLEKMIEKNIIHKFPGSKFELGKEIALSINTPAEIPIGNFYQTVNQMIKDKMPHIYKSVNITHSSSAIDLIPKKISKVSGIKWVIDKLNISQNEVAGIGDSFNDLGMLDFVEYAGAPSNAIKEVQKIVQEKDGHLSDIPYAGAVLEFIKKIIDEHN